MKLFDLATPMRSLYWRHRQRKLSLRGWSDFPADEFEGASVVVVGTAGYLKDLAQGPAIDAHDRVLRVDCFWHQGLDSAVGRRTDVRLTDFGSPQPEAFAARAPALVVSTLPNDAAGAPGPGPSECGAGRTTRAIERLGLWPVYVPERDWLRGKRRQLGQTPASDALAILFVLEFLAPRCGPIYLTGFSLFEDRESGGRTASSDAAPALGAVHESQLLRERLDWPLRMGSVRVDPVMAWHLRRPAARRRAAA